MQILPKLKCTLLHMKEFVFDLLSSRRFLDFFLKSSIRPYLEILRVTISTINLLADLQFLFLFFNEINIYLRIYVE